MNQFLFLDCDSTLCAIEGVDELAALQGPEIENRVIELTNQAMDGTVPIDEVFARRLDLIRPTQAMCHQVGQKYIEKLSPGVVTALTTLRQDGWQPIIISGGFTQVIEPVAKKLTIDEVYAVDLSFDDDGSYSGFDKYSPTARNGGKPDIIKSFLQNHPGAQTVMVGDGVSDLETHKVVDLFIGFGGVVAREKVVEGASFFINHFEELPETIKKHL